MEKTFSVLFSGNIAQLINFMGLLIFPSNEGGRVSRHPRSGKAEVITHRNSNVNKHVTCDLRECLCKSGPVDFA